jgi:hypothetical protein
MPQGLTDYQNLQTQTVVEPRFSEMPRGYTDYISPSE